MKLSIVIASRNDNHGGDLTERTQVFIDLLYQQMRRHSIEVELIFVEWNPPEDKPYLHTLLRWPKAGAWWSALAIIVPPDIHEVVASDAQLRFIQFWAKNVGIRQARHRWILCTNPDVIFSEELCDHLSGVKDGLAIYGTHRLDLDADVAEMPLDDTLDEVLEWCEEHTVRKNTITSGGVLTDGCGDFMMATKTAWNKLRGYPEMGIWSIHLDSLALMQLITTGTRSSCPGGSTTSSTERRGWTIWAGARRCHSSHTRRW